MLALALTRSIEYKAEDISVEYRLISLIERSVKSLNGVKGNGCVNGSRIQERSTSKSANQWLFCISLNSPL